MERRLILPLISCFIAWAALTGCPADDDDFHTGDDDAGDDDTGDDDTGDDDTGDDDTGDDDSADDDDTGDDDSADDDDTSGDDDSTADDDDSTGDDDTTSDPTVEILEIHLDNQTYAPVGYRQFALTGSPVSQGDAAQIVSIGLPGSLVDGCTPTATALEFHYCYSAPGDFGGAALVDGRTGGLVFGGEIIWMGVGQLLFPTPLGPAADLQVAVHPPTIAPNTIELFLNGYEQNTVGIAALDAVRAMDLVNNWVAWGTYDAMVYLHPYSVGAYDPAEADLVVFLVLN